MMIRRPSDPWSGRDDGARLSTPTRDHLPRTPVRVACLRHTLLTFDVLHVRNRVIILRIAEIML